MSLDFPRKRGRPKGIDKKKYWRVLYTLLHGPLSFSEIVSLSRLSRRFVAKVLKDALMRDVVGVNYHGHRAEYFLKYEDLALPQTIITIHENSESETQILEEPNSLFEEWWNLGRPQIDKFFEYQEDSRVLSFDYFTKISISEFLYECYPRLKISDPELWRNEDNLPSKLMNKGNVTFKELYEVVNDKRRNKIILEDLVLTRVVNALNDRLLCPICFRRGEAVLLEKKNDEFYICRNRRCGGSFKNPWKNSKIYEEYTNWRVLNAIRNEWFSLSEA